MRRRYEYQDFRVEIVGKSEGEVLFSEEYTVLLVIQGGLTVRLNEGEMVLGEGELIVNNSHTQMKIEAPESGIYAKLLFSEEILKRYFPNRRQQFRCMPGLGSESGYAKLKAAVETVLDFAVTAPEQQFSFRSLQLFYRMLELLCAYFTVSAPEPSGAVLEDSERERILSYMEEHYAESMTLQDVAEHTYVTYYYLSRKFKEMFGMKFYDLLNEIRMRHVMEDLVFTDKNMTRIAADHGFGSPSAFNRSFRSRFGTTPGEYQKKMRKRRWAKPEDSLTLPGGMTGADRIAPGSDEGEPEGAAAWENTTSVSGKCGREESDAGEVRAERLLSSQGKQLALDADSETDQPLQNPFLSMINGGHAADLCGAQQLTQVLTLCEELGFSCVRFWNPFCTEMEIRRGHNTEHLNFRRLDGILDALIEHGLRPWIDFGEKPHDIINLVGGQEPNLRDAGERSVFLSHREFFELLDKFMQHLVGRYGRAEVSGWTFEFWNYYYRVDRMEQLDIQDYLEWFDGGCRIIKKYAPDAEVGGDGTMVQYPIRETLEQWQHYRQPDFLSVIYYPYENPQPLPAHETGRVYNVDLFSLRESLERMRERLRQLGMRARLYVCEFNSTVSNRDYQNDSCYQSAFFMMNAAAAEGLADRAGYWCASDLPFYACDVEGPIFGGSGLVTADGLKKPVWYVLDFLRQLEPWLIAKNEHVLLTTDRCGNYALAAHHFQSMEHQYYMQLGVQWDVRRHIFKTGETLTLTVQIRHAKNGRYDLSVWRIGPRSGNLLGEWERLDFQENLSRRELQYLERVSGPSLEKRSVYAGEETLRFSVELGGQEVVLVRLRYRGDAD